MVFPGDMHSPERNKPTALTILREGTIVLTNVAGVKMRIFQILLSRSRKLHSLYSPQEKHLFRFRNLSSIGELSVFLFDYEHKKCTKIEIPDIHQQRLAFYLKHKSAIEQDENYHYSGGFDCKSFVDILNGWKKSEKLYSQRISLDQLSELPIGTTIMSYDRTEDGKYKGVHWSFLLGHGLILSKLGYSHNGGEIAVTTLEELQKIYSFHHIRIITKK